MSTLETVRSNPVLIVLLIAAPLVLLASLRRTYPAPRLVGWAALPCVLTIGLVWWREGLPFLVDPRGRNLENIRPVLQHRNLHFRLLAELHCELHTGILIPFRAGYLRGDPFQA